jgi:lysozyme
MDDTPIYRELLGDGPVEPPTAPLRVLPGARGVDTSRWQGAPDWARVRSSGYQFAYIKASQGDNASYPTAIGQYSAAIANGIVAGLYHYAEANLSPQSNALAFASQLKRLGALTSDNLPPCLDLEVPGVALNMWAQQFFKTLRAECNIQRVMLYTGSAYFKANLTDQWMDPDILLWIAHYGQPPGQPGYMSPRVVMHQYTQTERIPGIGTGDANYSMWPLSLIVGGKDTELTQEEHDMLVAVWQYLSGSETVGQWPGWPTWPGGTDENLSATDYLRRSNVETRQVFDEVKSLKDDVAELKEMFLNGQRQALDQASRKAVSAPRRTRAAGSV